MINTVDLINEGDLLAIMHAESLYTMLILIEKGMEATEFVHAVLANILMRILRIEVPRRDAEIILKSYDNQAIFAKTKSRSLVANLSTVIKDINAILEYHPNLSHDNKIDLARLEFKINESPRTLDGEYIWPPQEFYRSIRNLSPELPKRTPLPFGTTSMRSPENLMGLFGKEISDGLAIKVKASAIGAEVLFDLEEIQTLINTLEQLEHRNARDNKELQVDLLRMLNFQHEKLEKED